MGFDRVLDRTWEYFSLFFFGDMGLGSLHGGFGLVFWGLGFPCFLYFFIQGIRGIHQPAFFHSLFSSFWSKRGIAASRDYFPLFFWGQLAIGLFGLFYYAATIDLLSRSGRLTLYIAGLGLVALGVFLSEVENARRGAKLILKMVCIFGAFLTVVQMGSFRHPMYNLEKPLSDRIGGQYLSPMKYLFLGKVLEPLDKIGLVEEGLNVYIAAPYRLFFPSHFYGLNLQNRIWNFETQDVGEPDALVYYHNPLDRSLFYLKKKIKPQEVMFDPQYRLIVQDENSLFLLRSSLLDHPERKIVLADFYRRQYSQLIPTAQQLAAQLHPQGIVVTSEDVGYALRSLKLEGKITQETLSAPFGAERFVAEGLGKRLVYTIGKPLPGFRSNPVTTITMNDKAYQVFANQKN